LYHFQPDYEAEELERRFSEAMSGRLAERNKREAKSKEKKPEDPYYCGLRARVSNFAGKGPKKDRNIGRPLPNPAAAPAAAPVAHQHPQPGHMYHSRSYDSGMGNLPSYIITTSFCFSLLLPSLYYN
jgi:hypothetical protein